MRKLNNMDVATDEYSMYNFFLSLGIPFKCGRINMWSSDNVLDYIPHFKFRFTEFEKDHPFYKLLMATVNKFKGNIDWEIVTSEKSTNYVLKPKNFKLDNLSSRYTKDYDCKDDIQRMIGDIPFLIEHFKKEISII